MSLDPAKVSAVIVTMGDVDLTEITRHMPPEFGIVVWDNSGASRGSYPLVKEYPERAICYANLRGADFKVFGRYIAIRYATRPVIAFIDDDNWLSREQWQTLLDAYEPGVVTGNMIYDDPVWRDRYKDTTLLGWGAIFDRHLPYEAFRVWRRYRPLDWDFMTSPGGAEVVFPMLSRTKTVIAGASWLGEPGQEVYGRKNRMSNQPAFLERRLGWLDLARHVRDRARADGVLA